MSKGHQILLGIIGHYQMYRRKPDKTFKPLSWLLVNQKMFDEFHIDYDPNNYLHIVGDYKVNNYLEVKDDQETFDEFRIDLLPQRLPS